MKTRASIAFAIAACVVFESACSRSASAPQQRAAEPAPASGAASGTAPGAAPELPTTTAPVLPPSANQPVEGTGSSRGGGGVGSGTAPVPAGGTANPFDEHGGSATNVGGGSECSADGDCACGIDRSTGACAFGPSARIDTSRQCPDFCGGISGQMRVVCDRGRCVQR